MYPGERKWLDDQRRTARIAAEDAARTAVPCSECGNAEGLIAWRREHVWAAIHGGQGLSLPKSFYVAAGYDPDCLYTRCPTCRAATDDVLSRCALLTAVDIAAWVLEDECNCVLNQTCAVCNLAAQIEQEWKETPQPTVPDVWDTLGLWAIKEGL